MEDTLPWFLADPNPSVYRSGRYVLLDFETTNVDKGSPHDKQNSIVLAVWYTSWDKQWHAKFAGEYDQGGLCRDIAQADFIVAHNAKFELGWLGRCGVEIGNLLVYDTLLAEYCIGGNRWQFGALALDSISKRRYGEGKQSLVSLLIKSGVCPSVIPASWLEEYCHTDCELTLRLFNDQIKEIDDALLGVVYSRNLVTVPLVSIEAAGLQLDPVKVSKRHEELQNALAKSEKELADLVGVVNFNSPKQVASLLYDTLGFEELTKRGEPDRTDAGGRRTDVDTILKLRATTKEQRRVLEVFARSKELSSELSKYITKFERCCKVDGGLLFAAFNQSNTQTHRLSSSGRKYKTQFQNLPRHLKPLFKAKREGWLVCETDGSQLEFRVAGHLGRDAVILEDLVAKRDVHSTTANMLGVSRQDAKTDTFKPLYGGKSGTKKQVAYYEYFRTRYAGITAKQNDWINEVLISGKLRTEWGLTFYWPDTRMEGSGYIRNSTSICNYPVQSFATADIIPISLVYFYYRAASRGYALQLVNTVHDSIIAEVPPDEVESFHSLAKQCLIDDVYPYLEKVYNVKLTVPLGCEVTWGTHWGCKDNETKYDAEPSLYQ